MNSQSSAGFVRTPSLAVEWERGKQNARIWVLQLLHDGFAPGDKIVEIAPAPASAAARPRIYSRAKKTGRRKLLLVDKRDRDFEISVPGASGGQVEVVDVTTGFQPLRQRECPRTA